MRYSCCAIVVGLIVVLLLLHNENQVCAAPTVELRKPKSKPLPSDPSTFAFVNDPVADGQQEGPIETIHLVWCAPIFSSTGYGSEAVEILHGMEQLMSNSTERERLRQEHAEQRRLKFAPPPELGGEGDAEGSGVSQTAVLAEQEEEAAFDDYVKEIGRGDFRGVKMQVSAEQHGDTSSRELVEGWSDSHRAVMQGLVRNAPSPSSLLLQDALTRGKEPLVVICHSEPGAWALPRPNYKTMLCPPVLPGDEWEVLEGGSGDEDEDDEDGRSGPPEDITTVEEESFRESLRRKHQDGKTVKVPRKPTLLIGRTMFETDRLPNGWLPRLLLMDEVWVPSAFHVDIFVQSGVPREKIFVLPEALDAENEWTPDAHPPHFFDADFGLWESLTTRRESAGIRTVLNFEPKPAVLARVTINGVTKFPSGRSMKTFASATSINGRAGNRVRKSGSLAEIFAAECQFRFLSVFKWEERKGWDVLLQAFYEEFHGWGEVVVTNTTKTTDGSTTDSGSGDRPTPPDVVSLPWNHGESVCLVLKTTGYHNEEIDDEDEMEEYLEQMAEHFSKWYGKSWRQGRLPKILVIPHHIPASLYPSLYSSVHALVQPSRGEGWGRPHMEAMALGLPVLATNWSGNTAFMNATNSFLIEVERFSEIKKGPFRGHRWAEPSVASLRRLMREVVTKTQLKEPSLTALKAQARRTILEEYSPSSVASIALNRVIHLLGLAGSSSTGDGEL
jgi:glycosyltransferase involved in cell wall biosynthesis